MSRLRYRVEAAWFHVAHRVFSHRNWLSRCACKLGWHYRSYTLDTSLTQGRDYTVFHEGCFRCDYDGGRAVL